MVYETLDLRQEGPVDWLTLNRPGSLNAMNPRLVTELRDYLSELPARQETRIMVLRGAEMLATSPLGLRLTKECLTASLDAGSLDQVIAMEDRNQILCSRSTDFREGIRAFLEKRAPQYGDA